MEVRKQQVKPADLIFVKAGKHTIELRDYRDWEGSA